jgi:hypothetical protein
MLYSTRGEASANSFLSDQGVPLQFTQCFRERLLTNSLDLFHHARKSWWVSSK